MKEKNKAKRAKEIKKDAKGRELFNPHRCECWMFPAFSDEKVADSSKTPTFAT